MNKDQLLAIEEGFWYEGADYYEQHITAEATFVFPGMVLGKDDGMAAADAAPRWDSLELSEIQLIELSDDVAVLTYHATGQRDGEEPYTGNITTVYRLENGAPKMAFHQQTPDPAENSDN